MMPLPRPAPPGPSLLPIGAALLAQISFAAGASIAKQLFPRVGAEGAVAMRLFFGAVILVLAFRPWRHRVTGGWPSLIAYGLTLGLMNLLFYLALRTVPLGLAIAIEFTGPLGVAVATSRRAMDLLWVALAATGLVLLLPVADLRSGVDPGGALLALAAGGCWATYILLGQRVGRAHGGVAVAIGMAIAAAAVVPVGIAHVGSSLFAPGLLGLGLGVGILSSALPYLLEMVALRALSANAYGTVMSTDPAVGALIGFFMLGEALRPGQWVAILLVTAASAGAAMTDARRREDAAALA